MVESLKHLKMTCVLTCSPTQLTIATVKPGTSKYRNHPSSKISRFEELLLPSCSSICPVRPGQSYVLLTDSFGPNQCSNWSWLPLAFTFLHLRFRHLKVLGLRLPLPLAVRSALDDAFRPGLGPVNIASLFRREWARTYPGLSSLELAHLSLGLRNLFRDNSVYLL